MIPAFMRFWVARPEPVGQPRRREDATLGGSLALPCEEHQLVGGEAATDAEEKLRISRLIGVKRLAAGVTEELDAVFKALLK